ncbi:hypothetical protein [Paenibacillus wynnii]|uniref:Uncharacterized protein n=1 Tax=Paenibacillus wynnii TaxID=268407 RepID=A0A098M2N2_9BACL|nr:hypothetical protein [Paenibacillus wynnii]KGE16238.1 hypothetical protein PWYN_15870 [Paenibacillus wynnii]KGE21100.1 hypothetical protein PWYN_02900 [Paenibacillus wynnii]
MITIPMLQNLYQYQYYNLFKSHDIPNYNKRAGEEGKTSAARYRMIHKIMTEELVTGNLTPRVVDEFLFENLYYSNMNYHFVYRLSEFVHDFNTPTDVITQFFNENSSLNWDKLLTEESGSSLLTLRLDTEDNHLIGIKMLLKIDTIRTRKFEEQDVYAGIYIDLLHNLVSFRFNLSQLERISKEPLAIISELKNLLCATSVSGLLFEPLRININSLNETAARKCIFNLFEELSLEAEQILNAHTPPETEDKIKEFLTTMRLRTITGDYIQQIKAVLYQEISTKIRGSVFEKGWIFRFVFREGLTTRASSRTDDSGPIYGSKIYWHLKELIFKERELYEAGFSWYLPWLKNGEPDSILVRMESRNDSIILNYYRNTTFRRGDKERYVLQQINANLQ